MLIWEKNSDNTESIKRKVKCIPFSNHFEIFWHICFIILFLCNRAMNESWSRINDQGQKLRFREAEFSRTCLPCSKGKPKSQGKKWNNYKTQRLGWEKWKCILLSERSPSENNCKLHDSSYLTLWKRQGCEDNEKIRLPAVNIIVRRERGMTR